MRIALLLEYAGDPITEVRRVAEQERAGIDIIWVSEAYGFDAPTLMGYLAATTRRAEIGSAVLNVYSRTPAALAQTVAGLDAASGGRAILGLGSSGPQVVEGFHGLPFDKPLTRVVETVEVVRQALRRAHPISLDGRSVTVPYRGPKATGLGRPLRLINHPVRSQVPIFLAAAGAAGVKATAGVADGWLPPFFIPEWSAEVWKEPLEAGLARRDPALGRLEVAAGGMLAIAEGERRERLLDRGRHQLALYVGGVGAKGKNFYNDLMAHYGHGEAARVIQDLYLAGRKDEAAAAVPREVLEKVNLVGSEGFIKERIAAYAESGVTILNVTPLTEDLTEIERVRSWLP